MRGSPILRTFWILVVVVASGFLFVRLTASPKTKVAEDVVEEVGGKRIPAKAYLTFSERATSLDLSTGDQNILMSRMLTDGKKGDFREWAGELNVDPDSPAVFVKVEWESIEKGHRFAKLVVEAEGKKTFTHVFDAEGNIDDFVELPF